MYKQLTILFLLFSFTFSSNNVWEELDGLHFVKDEVIVMFRNEISPLLGQESPLDLESRSDLSAMINNIVWTLLAPYLSNKIPRGNWNNAKVRK